MSRRGDSIAKRLANAIIERDRESADGDVALSNPAAFAVKSARLAGSAWTSRWLPPTVHPVDAHTRSATAIWVAGRIALVRAFLKDSPAITPRYMRFPPSALQCSPENRAVQSNRYTTIPVAGDLFVWQGRDYLAITTGPFHTWREEMPHALDQMVTPDDMEDIRPLVVPSWTATQIMAWRDEMWRYLQLLDSLAAEPERKMLALGGMTALAARGLTALTLALVSTRQFWLLPEVLQSPLMNNRWRSIDPRTLYDSTAEATLAVAQARCAARPDEILVAPIPDSGFYDPLSRILLLGCDGLATECYPYRRLPVALDNRIKEITSGIDQFGEFDPNFAHVLTTKSIAPSLIYSGGTVNIQGAGASSSQPLTAKPVMISSGVTAPVDANPGDIWINTAASTPTWAIGGKPWG